MVQDRANIVCSRHKATKTLTFGVIAPTAMGDRTPGIVAMVLVIPNITPAYLHKNTKRNNINRSGSDQIRKNINKLENTVYIVSRQGKLREIGNLHKFDSILGYLPCATILLLYI